MKKVLVLLVTVLAFNLSNAQSKFRIPTETEQSLAGQYVVLESKGSVKENYKKVIDFISKSYNTPSEVIKSTIDNEYIRIQGNSDMVVNNRSISIKHQLEFHFKEDRIKVTLINLETTTIPRTDLTLQIQYSNMYKSNGKPKTSYIKYSNQVVSGLNDLVNRFDLGINEVKDTNNDW